MRAYIINIPDSVDRVVYINVNPMNGKTYTASYSVENLTPYTEPDLEQIKKEAYEQGRKDGKIEGQAETWVCVKKIALHPEEGGIVLGDIRKIFGCSHFQTVFRDYSASEAIEKIRQYEYEQDRQARIEYNFDEIKDVLETTAKECNVSLDEIAEVLRKMGETNNG